MNGPLLRAALRLELWAARAIGGKREPKVIEPFIGYATPDAYIVQGRVHSRLRQDEVRFEQGRLANFIQMISMFLTSEVAHAEVRCGEQTVKADEEGYFRIEVPRDGRTGLLTFAVSLPAVEETFDCPVIVHQDTAGPVVISDIDDTVMHTGAYSLVRNLWTSLTGNPLTRQIFPDSAVLLDRLVRDQAAAVFYVSSSPWNLFRFLRAVFERNAVAAGPMFLRDLGLDDGKFITDGHGDHKGAAIDTIVAAVPERPVVLIGDTGQEDAHVYREAAVRHRERIAAVILRTPGPSLDHVDLRHIEALRDQGVLTLYGRSFADFDMEIAEALGSRRVSLQKGA